MNHWLQHSNASRATNIMPYSGMASSTKDSSRATGLHLFPLPLADPTGDNPRITPADSRTSYSR